MKCLVDTHVLIWSVVDSKKLSEAAKAILRDGENECFFSAASVWEIALKHSKHPKDIPIGGEDARQLFLEAGYLEFPVFAKHSAVVERLPDIHQDPFDRMLVAQAQMESMKLLTHDHILPQYGTFVIRV